MRILELGKFYAPERGGIETLLKIWAEGFVAAGDDVRCVVANRRWRTESETKERVPVVRLGSFGMAFSTSLCPAYPFSGRRWRSDVIHAHAPNPLADLAILAAPRRTPVVISWHSDVIRQQALMKLYAPIQRAVLRRADVVVVATENHLRYSPWLTPIASKVRVIPFGLDLDRFRSTPEVEASAARWRGKARGQTVFLNLGRLVGYKGQRFAIEALGRLPHGVLWIAGTGPLEAELRELAKRCGVAERVEFLGDVPDSELPGLLHACDVFVFPSITPNEAFGLVLVEAMACGKPLVACDLKSGVPCVCRDGINGLVVPPSDTIALATAMRSLLDRKELRVTLGGAGKQLAESEFSAPVMVARYRSLFREWIAVAKG
jgi:glycosyltransferase involved in cell wall biosynthesis